ncbi:MAG: hypothetical protein Q8888_02240 [Vigna little leaf phytoplasma]|nr:hypothetical protein [Vigna little leaf phytoplasma]
MQKTINDLLNKLSFNKRLLYPSQINSIKNDIKTKIMEELNNSISILVLTPDSTISVEQIKEKIEEITKQIVKKIFEEKWKEIFNKIPPLNLSYFAQNKIMNQIKKQNEKKIFYNDLNEEEILDILYEDMKNKIKYFYEDLNLDISNDVRKYILIDHILGKNIDRSKLNIIVDDTILFAKTLLNQENIMEEEFNTKIYDFVKNYKFNDQVANYNSQLFFFIQKNFLFIILFIMLILLFKKKKAI